MMREMTLTDIESVILRLAEDSYISNKVRRDILELYFDERKTKLDKAFEYTEANVLRLSEMNELFIRQVTDIMHRAHEIYQTERELLGRESHEYDHVEVTACIEVPCDIEALSFPHPDRLTDRDVMLWQILSSKNLNRALDYQPILGTVASTFSEYNDDTDLEKRIDETLYTSCDNDNVRREGWACMMKNIDQEKVKDICIVWPLHNLYDYGNFAMTDILKIKKFNTKVEIVYEVY